MAVALKHAFAWTIFILSYGQLIAEDDTDTRIVDLETLAAKVDFSAYKNADQLDNLKLRIQELQDGTKMDGIKVRQVADPNIGFDARVVALKPHYVDQQTIVFNRVQVNQGGGYSNTTGRFTCPQHGLYQFAATIPSQLNGTIECEMVMDNVQIGRFMANEPGFDQATQVVVLECGVEQQVWIRHLRGVHDTGILAGRHHFPSFSGHLISSL
ncbi:Cerebellin-3 [Mizuhopecten yessoensis]|uniref:Cerebellin-3 n=1 Tax=Mizuhopecten yessoensis TaxID=6573 RepID=A0A210PHT4_MIZYE|nr:Cerebellin-3 [Mizuhopecten yessoensis]